MIETSFPCDLNTVVCSRDRTGFGVSPGSLKGDWSLGFFFLLQERQPTAHRGTKQIQTVHRADPHLISDM